jgi:hypothetical protein
MFILWSYSPVKVSYGSENVFLVFLLSFRGSGLVTSNAAVGGGRHPLPVPACGGPGAPPPTAAEVAQASHQSLRRNTRRPEGEAGKQRASELPDLYAPQFGWCQHEDLVFSPKGHCHKMARKCSSECNLQSARADWSERANYNKIGTSLSFRIPL